MKKLICLMLCLLIPVSLSGCKKSDSNEVKHDTNIKKYVNKGSVPEAAFSLGDTAPEEDKDSEEYYFLSDGKQKYISSSDGGFYYFYSSDDTREITAIAALADCYGFDHDTVSIEITKVLDAQGIKYEKRAQRSGELSFLPNAPDRDIVECTGLDHTLVFVFDNNSLCAAYLY